MTLSSNRWNVRPRNWKTKGNNDQQISIFISVRHAMIGPSLFSLSQVGRVKGEREEHGGVTGEESDDGTEE